MSESDSQPEQSVEINKEQYTEYTVEATDLTVVATIEAQNKQEANELLQENLAGEHSFTASESDRKSNISIDVHRTEIIED